MKKTLFTIAILSSTIAASQAVLINGGFQLTKGGLDVITDSAGGTDPFASYSKGVGSGISVLGTDSVIYDDLTTTTGPVDMLGWSLVPGKDNPDAGTNGVGGSQGLNIFASWGGQQRVVGETTDTILAGATYTITAQIDGVAGGPMNGPLAFDLMANGIALTADAAIPSFTATPGTFQTITRTYSNVVLPGGVSDGDALTVLVGVDDSNGLDNRMIWDDVGLTVSVIPEPSSALLLSLGGLVLMRRRRN